MLQTTFLYYLIQISHCQSLSIAAEKLHISQPALSASIKKLEEQLGVKLLNRTYKGVTLTDDGKNVVELAEKAFDYIQQIEATYKRPNNTAQYTFKDLHIYCNPAYSSLMMQALSNTLSKDIIEFYTLTPELDVNKLLRNNPNNIVLGIISDTHTLPDDILAIKLCTSQAYIMCAQDFPYIDPLKSSISFKEILHIPLSVVNHSFDFQKILLDHVKQYGEPNIKILAPDSNSVTSSVLTGMTAGFSNKFFDSNSNNTIRYLPIRNAPKFHLALTYHHTADKDKVQNLAELIKEKVF